MVTKALQLKINEWSAYMNVEQSPNAYNGAKHGGNYAQIKQDNCNFARSPAFLRPLPRRRVMHAHPVAADWLMIVSLQVVFRTLDLCRNPRQKRHFPAKSNCALGSSFLVFKLSV